MPSSSRSLVAGLTAAARLRLSRLLAGHAAPPETDLAAARSNVARVEALLAEATTLLESTAGMLAPAQAGNVDAVALGAAETCAHTANALADLAADLAQAPSLRIVDTGGAHPRQLCAWR